MASETKFFMLRRITYDLEIFKKAAGCMDWMASLLSHRSLARLAFLISASCSGKKEMLNFQFCLVGEGCYFLDFLLPY